MKSVVAVTVALLLLAPMGVAEEARSETVEAARVGRLLLSHEEAKRAQGEALLLARVAKGGDLKPYVKAMANAARRWANDEHRLVETWIRQAVEGDLEQREQAVRLITAMGEKAVMRLALELRHQTQQDGFASAEADPAPAAAQDLAEPSPLVPQMAAKPHMPAVYDVTALKQRGLNPVQVVNFLRKEADASEVGSGPTRFVVYADADGHQRLALKLAEIRKDVAQAGAAARDTGAARKDEKEPQPQADKPERAGGGPPPPAPPPTADAASGDALPQTAVPAPTTGVGVSGPQWTVQPVVIRVPRDASLAKRVNAWKDVEVDVITPLLGDAEQTKRQVRATPASVVGTLAAVSSWMENGPALPEARTSYGEQIAVLAGREAQGFVGKQVPYRRGVRQAKKHGAWQVDQDILQSGLELRFQLTAGANALALRVEARLSEVSKPMATQRVRPAKDAEPIELDMPEWNRQSRSDTFQIPVRGGGLLMAMPDPAKADTGIVLILLKVEPVPTGQQIRQNANGNPGGAPPSGGRDGNN